MRHFNGPGTCHEIVADGNIDVQTAPAGTSAQAQLTPPSAAGAKPKPVTTVPIRPALQTPADTANAMAQAERLAMQSDLAWVGQYNGAITGEVSERMVAAIKEFQKGRGGKQTGVLNPQERGILADTAKRKQENVGWKIVTDLGTGVRLGVPTKLVPQQSTDANGAKWTSATGTVQIQLARRKEANPTTAKLAEQEKKEPAGRKIDYTVVKPDFFVLSGCRAEEILCARDVQRRRGPHPHHPVRPGHREHRRAGRDRDVERVQPISRRARQSPGPPPRKTVEYGTGIVVSGDGAIIADRQVTDGCLAIAISGHGNADRVAEDKDYDLALLRIYGARGLKPLNPAMRGKNQRRTDRHCRSAESGRRWRGEQRQGIGHASRQRQRSALRRRRHWAFPAPRR